MCVFRNREEWGRGGVLSGFPTDKKTASLVDREQWYSKIIIQTGQCAPVGSACPHTKEKTPREQGAKDTAETK